MWYHSGSFWVVIWDSSALAHRFYCKNATESTWTLEYSISSAVSSADLRVKYNGTHIHYTRSASSNLYYRLGTLNAGCGLTWIAGESLVTSSNYNIIYVQYIEEDDSNNIWILYQIHQTSNYQGLYAIKNSAKDGTWVTADSETIQPSTSSASWGGVLLADEGTVVAIYSGGYYKYLYANQYTVANSSFGTNQISSGIRYVASPGEITGFVRDGNYLLVAYEAWTSGGVSKMVNESRFVIDSGWQGNSIVESYSGTPSMNPQAQYLNATANAIYFQNYPTAKDLNYKEYVSSWGSEVELTNDTSTVTGILTEDVLRYTSKWACYYGGTYPSLFVKCYISNTTAPSSTQYETLADSFNLMTESLIGTCYGCLEQPPTYNQTEGSVTNAVIFQTVDFIGFLLPALIILIGITWAFKKAGAPPESWPIALIIGLIILGVMTAMGYIPGGVPLWLAVIAGIFVIALLLYERGSLPLPSRGGGGGGDEY